MWNDMIQRMQYGGAQPTYPTITPNSTQIANPTATPNSTQPAGVEKVGNKSNPTKTEKTAKTECQTCKERKYQDGSDEGNVSFKSAAHISPEAAGARVRAHEGEHVANAYKKAEMNNGKVLRASVSIHTAICPECGRTYVSGGTTHTQIRYGNEESAFQKNLKSQQSEALKGNRVDLSM